MWTGRNRVKFLRHVFSRKWSLLRIVQWRYRRLLIFFLKCHIFHDIGCIQNIWKICLEKTQASILEYIQLNFLKNCVNLAVISNMILKDVKIYQDYSTSNLRCVIYQCLLPLTKCSIIVQHYSYAIRCTCTTTTKECLYIWIIQTADWKINWEIYYILFI